MKQKVVDILPGRVFEKESALDPSIKHFFLKLHEQKVVNLSTNTLCRSVDQQEEVNVIRHPLDSYLVVGGINEEG